MIFSKGEFHSKKKQIFNYSAVLFAQCTVLWYYDLYIYIRQKRDKKNQSSIKNLLCTWYTGLYEAKSCIPLFHNNSTAF